MVKSKKKSKGSAYINEKDFNFTFIDNCSDGSDSCFSSRHGNER